MSSEPIDSDDSKTRFLVTMTKEDLDALDKARKAQSLSRNRFVVLAVWKMIRATPGTIECAICGKSEEDGHVH